jgi:hypothetical protein
VLSAWNEHKLTIYLSKFIIHSKIVSFLCYKNLLIAYMQRRKKPYWQNTYVSCLWVLCVKALSEHLGKIVAAGNTKGRSITVQLTSCLTGLDWSVLQIKTKIVSSLTADSKPVKQEVNGTVILSPLVFPGCWN